MVRILVNAKAGVKKELVELLTPPSIVFPGEEQKIDIYKVSVSAPAVDGRANEAIQAALAKHLGIAKSCVVLISGTTAKKKVFEIYK
jgi:uncharacterized protein YggU (UPF0235/DUF167 family)